jgi:hypothetical protein
MKRIASGQVREIIMGTNPNMEGDGTALHLQNLIAQYPNVSVTRLARGFTVGQQHRVRQPQHPRRRDQRPAADVGSVLPLSWYAGRGLG